MLDATIKERGHAAAIHSLTALNTQALQAAGRGLEQGLRFAVAEAQLLATTAGHRPKVVERLRRSVSHEVTVTRDAVVGTIGTDAAFHEVGFHGVVTVPAHTRQAAHGTAPVQVKAYTQRVDYDGRPFVRPALERALPVIQREVEAELAALTSNA